MTEETRKRYKTEALKKDWGNFISFYVTEEKEDRIIQICDKCFGVQEQL